MTTVVASQPRESLGKSDAMGRIKRMEDLIFVSMLIVLILPIMAICAIAVKLESPGPILFRQRRRGCNGDLIWVYKFRSMHTRFEDEACIQQSAPGDPRVTRVGSYLRRHSLDELPQLWNVLRGEMSLIGPRPHAVFTSIEGRLIEDLSECYRRRYSVRPGITGWAQVNGWRGELDTVEKLLKRIEYDLHYIENWSITFDLKILAWTVASVFQDDQAF